MDACSEVSKSGFSFFKKVKHLLFYTAVDFCNFALWYRKMEGMGAKLQGKFWCVVQYQ